MRNSIALSKLSKPAGKSDPYSICHLVRKENNGPLATSSWLTLVFPANTSTTKVTIFLMLRYTLLWATLSSPVTTPSSAKLWAAEMTSSRLSTTWFTLWTQISLGSTTSWTQTTSRKKWETSSSSQPQSRFVLVRGASLSSLSVRRLTQLAMKRSHSMERWSSCSRWSYSRCTAFQTTYSASCRAAADLLEEPSNTTLCITPLLWILK